MFNSLLNSTGNFYKNVDVDFSTDFFKNNLHPVELFNCQTCTKDQNNIDARWVNVESWLIIKIKCLCFSLIKDAW
jgi:hypothetical protein